MSVISLLLGQPQRGTRISRDLTANGIAAAVLLDATLKESFSADSELTQHPVERGADISDHIILKPQSVSIEGKISETPFSIGGQIAGVVSTVASKVGQQLGGALGGVAATAVASKTLAGVLSPNSVTRSSVSDTESSRSGIGLPNENIRLRDAVQEFLNLRSAKAPVTIVTGLKIYKDYVLTSFSVDKDNSMGKSLVVNLKFVELQLATVETIGINIPGEKQGLGAANLGSKSPVPAAADSSIAYGIVHGN